MPKDDRKSMWEEGMAAYKASGQSARMWCAENRVKLLCSPPSSSLRSRS